MAYAPIPPKWPGLIIVLLLFASSPTICSRVNIASCLKSKVLDKAAWHGMVGEHQRHVVILSSCDNQVSFISSTSELSD